MKIRYILIYIIIIILTIGIPTIIKIRDSHYNKLYKVIENNIIYNANLCIRDNICQNKKITLKQLVDNNYIDLPVDPKTDKYYNENYYVINENNTITFYK